MQLTIGQVEYGMKQTVRNRTQAEGLLWSYQWQAERADGLWEARILLSDGSWQHGQHKTLQGALWKAANESVVRFGCGWSEQTGQRVPRKLGKPKAKPRKPKQPTLENIERVVRMTEGWFEPTHALVHHTVGYVGQFKFDAIRGEALDGYTVLIDMSCEGIQDEFLYVDKDHYKTPANHWKVAVARATRKATTAHDVSINLNLRTLAQQKEANTKSG